MVTEMALVQMTEIKCSRFWFCC